MRTTTKLSLQLATFLGLSLGATAGWACYNANGSQVACNSSACDQSVTQSRSGGSRSCAVPAPAPVTDSTLPEPTLPSNNTSPPTLPANNPDQNSAVENYVLKHDPGQTAAERIDWLFGDGDRFRGPSYWPKELEWFSIEAILNAPKNDQIQYIARHSYFEFRFQKELRLEELRDKESEFDEFMDGQRTKLKRLEALRDEAAESGDETKRRYFAEKARKLDETIRKESLFGSSEAGLTGEEAVEKERLEAELGVNKPFFHLDPYHIDLDQEAEYQHYRSVRFAEERSKQGNELDVHSIREEVQGIVVPN